MAKGPTVEVENIISPGSRRRVDAGKYEAMKKAMVAVLPDAPPGIAVAGIKPLVVPLLPAELFPGGDKAGWWIKCVQLDLEAKGVLNRTERPVRLYRA